MARATPATSRWNTITRKRFNAALKKPEKTKAIRGRFVSPTHLRIAEPKLYAMMNGIPSAYMRRYVSAYGNTFSGVFIATSTGRDTTRPRKRRKTPLIKATVIAVWTLWFAFSFSPRPIKRETTTFAPTDIPTKRFIIRFMTGPLHPTAAVASAGSDAKCPTTATSTALNSCCNMLLAARGIAKKRILSAKEPESMSILRAFASIKNSNLVVMIILKGKLFKLEGISSSIEVY